MLRKIRKLILHPNMYFYDYFRKKLGFRKFFVTDKIKLLDAGNHQKWFKVLFTHPYLYLYYKFNKRLRNPAYPILIDYRIESMEKNGMGGGKSLLLVVELERHNTIYFADPEIVMKVLNKKEPYLAGVIFKIGLIGSNNSVFFGSFVRFGRDFRINLNGNNNVIQIYTDCNLDGGLITVKGNSNSIYLGPACNISRNVQFIFSGNDNSIKAKKGVQFMQGSIIVFQKNGNLAYLGSDTKVSPSSRISFNDNNSLLYSCGNCTLNLGGTSFRSNSILFYGYGGGFSTKDCRLREGKNIIIGSDCLFSYDIYFINATGHAIYDGKSKERISKGQSIIIGDHVWVGCNVSFIKGNIGSGTMIGAKSHVVRNIPAGCVAAGNPAKVIHENILWTNEGPGDGEVESLSYFETYQAPIQELKPIGWERLLKIDEIVASTPALEKVGLIHKILNS